MIVQINTDRNIMGHEAMARQAEATVTDALGYLAECLSRVEVHLSDVNAKKGGDNDKRCMMEARMEGRQPIAVTDEAATVEQAIDGAADKLKSALESTLGRLDETVRPRRRHPLQTELYESHPTASQSGPEPLARQHHARPAEQRHAPTLH